MFTKRIVKLPPLLRVPLWALWFPLIAYPWHLLLMLLGIGPVRFVRRVFTVAHWRLTWRIYLIGLDGR